MTATVAGPTLACHYWSLYDLEIEAACLEAARLGYAGMDLGSGDIGHGVRLDVRALEDVTTCARLARAAGAAGIRFTDLFAALPHRIDDPDAARVQANAATFAWIVAHSSVIGLPGVTLSPGGYEPDEHEVHFMRSADALSRLVAIGASAGVGVSIEPHVGSVTDTPERTLRMLDRVPGLTLTLDYSHFVVAGFGADEIEVLHPHARHWHARQNRPGRLSVPVDEGTIDFGRIIADLAARAYGGAITTEYVASPWGDQDTVDVPTENARMATTLRSLLGSHWQGAAA